jgi:hypothetical protein
MIGRTSAPTMTVTIVPAAVPSSVLFGDSSLLSGRLPYWRPTMKAP